MYNYNNNNFDEKINKSGIATPSLKGKRSGLRSIMELCLWNVMMQLFEYAHVHLSVNAIQENSSNEDACEGYRR